MKKMTVKIGGGKFQILEQNFRHYYYTHGGIAIECASHPEILTRSNRVETIFLRGRREDYDNIVCEYPVEETDKIIKALEGSEIDVRIIYENIIGRIE